MIKKIRNNLQYLYQYVYDSTIDIKKRSFLLFSAVVLFALLAAIPCGLIMHEPLTATLSTIAGTLFFFSYISYAIRRQRIDRARKVISFILVFIFLPSMFFTNGGEAGGTPIWLMLGTIYIALILDGRFRIAMLIMNAAVTAITWTIGYCNQDLVISYSREGNYFDTLAAFFIVGSVIYILIIFQSNLFSKEEENKTMHRMFEQTATALVNAIDAKDTYTHGHSARVAEYSKKIAQEYGKSRKECEEIYFTALLHDVGKIGVPSDIINKVGKLTDEEYEIIKQHPALGAQILESIHECPYLVTGAMYHHERYDGKGYPKNLKGTDIPETARIIAVADAYDAMTSKRSYRDAIPQHIVREELVKGLRTQFDPEFAKIMIRLIDLDSEYEMQERIAGSNMTAPLGIHCGTIYDNCTDGVVITRKKASISFCSLPDKGFTAEDCIPTLVIFDSLDGRVHPGEEKNKDVLYYEYARIKLDGTVTANGVREHRYKDCGENENSVPETAEESYFVEAVRNRDHVLVKVTTRRKIFEVVLALPDTSRYAHVSISGQHCEIHNITVETDEHETPAEVIPRIAEEISYTKNCPTGDVPNVEVDGPRLSSSKGIPILDGMTLSFHTMSYQTARLVWHCPYFCLFYSSDGNVYGSEYREYLLLKLNGENWDSAEDVDNKITVEQKNDFEGWTAWLEKNKLGIDCTVTIKRVDNKIIMQTENLGIALHSVSTINDGTKDIFVALTGDQCAISDIRVKRN
ncbi:HD domain-containing protein [Ruminococcus albus]|uniref:HD domain-containing protein n=1 Tax=Ruminococcus albus TaxID=1264 RepID=A0A1I1PYX4_RUMAL|nr:HD domain-containing protein [Ruminococcus albus]